MFFLCLFGKGTKISKYLIDHDKVYQVVLKLGIQTDTGDREGSIIKEQDVDLKHLEEENVEKVLKSFLGKQSQVPPMYSAIKVKRKKIVWICKRRKKSGYRTKTNRNIWYKSKQNRKKWNIFYCTCIKRYIY